MSTVENGILKQLSVTQVTKFDHAQTGGCELKWYFEAVEGRRPEQDEAQTDGEAGHKLLAFYLEHGKLPEGRARMKTVVSRAIAKGELPKPGPDMLVEWRASGQPKTDDLGAWVPLDTSNTFWLGGVPWDVHIDLTYRRGPVPHVLDHKFGANVSEFALESRQLIHTVQMPVYALAREQYWPDAERWRLTHHYVARTGSLSFMRSAVVTRDQLYERRAEIEGIVERMKAIARAPSATDVPFNRKSCETWRGCPHQSICSHYKERHVAKLTDEEKALFNELDGGDSTPVPPASAEEIFEEEGPPAAAPQEEDEEAALLAQLAKVKAAKAAAAKPAPTPAPAKKPAKERKIEIEDVPAELSPPVKAPTPAAGPLCEDCGTQITRDNGSQLKSKAWVHIGCPAKAKAAPEPAPAKKPSVPQQAIALALEPSKAISSVDDGPVTIQITIDRKSLASIAAALAR